MEASRNRKNHTGLFIALSLCVIGGLGANLLQTDFAQVAKDTLVFKSESGHLLSIDLYVPKTATAKTPAPVIVWAHGGISNNERSDSFQIEWARRGFVVLAVDLYSHGDSEILNNTDWYHGGRGVYDAVKYALTLPYVDPEHVAVSGLSRGGNSCHESILLDNNAPKRLISAVLYVGRDAVYRNNETASFGYYPGMVNTQMAAERGGNGDYYNFYGNRSVGIIADKYDDYSFKEKDPATGRMKPNPNYPTTNNARSFVNFGATPEAATPPVEVGKWYKKEIDSKLAERIVYMPLSIHGMTVYVPEVIRNAVDFFNHVFPAPASIPAADIAISQYKSLFSLLAFVGFFLFLVYFCLVAIRRPFFASLQSSEPAVMRPAGDGSNRVWLWACLFINTLFPILAALLLFHLKMDKVVNQVFTQVVPFFYGVWGVTSAAVLLATVLAWYYCSARKQGVTAATLDLSLGGTGQFGKTLLLGVYVAASAYVLVFAMKYFFNTDFRFLYWSARPIGVDRLFHALRIMPFFAVFYILNSVVVNSMNFSACYGKSERANIWLLAFLNLIPPLVLCGGGYLYFFITGINGLYPVNTQIPDWMLTPLVPLFISPFITRAIYKQTRNPYLGGVINAIVVTLMTCATTQTTFPA